MESGQLRSIMGRLRRAVIAGGADGPTDADLLGRFVRTGDQTAFELLAWRHGGMVLGTCRRVLGNAHDAEDAFQATFLTLVRKARAIARHGAVAGWLYKVAYRIALDLQARNRRRGEQERKAQPPPPPDPAQEAARHDLAAVVDEEIRRLPEKYRAPLILCVMEGRSLEEAARQLNCPRATVGTWLARARERLRGRLARRGVTLSATVLAAALAGPVDAGPSAVLVGQTVQAARRLLAGEVPAVAPAVLGLAERAAAQRWWPTLLLAVVLLPAFGAVIRGGGEDEPGPPAAVVNAPPTREGFAEEMPEGWFGGGGAAEAGAYAVGVDRAVRHGGRASGSLRARAGGGRGFGFLAQAIRADAYLGQRLRLSGWVRTAGAAEAALWMRVDGTEQTLAFDNRQDRPQRGPQPWAHQEVVLDVTAEAREVSFGLWMSGPGQAWVDDLALAPAGPTAAAPAPAAAPVPIPRIPVERPAAPANLDFEGLAGQPQPNRADQRIAIPGLTHPTGGPVLEVITAAGTVTRWPAAAAVQLDRLLPDRASPRPPAVEVNLGDYHRGLVRFEVPPAEAVRRAELVLPLLPTAMPPGRAFDLGVCEVLEPWVVGRVTWALQPRCGAPAATAPVRPADRTVRIDVTRLVQGRAAADWLLKVVRPVPLDPAGTPAEVTAALRGLVPWAETLAEAEGRARAEGKLILACLRAPTAAGVAAERRLLVNALADPDLAAVICHRCVPARLETPAAPGLAFGPGSEPPGPLTLEIRTPDGATLARLSQAAACDRGTLLHSLTQALDQGPGDAGPADPWDLLAAGRSGRAREIFRARGGREGQYGLCRVAAVEGDPATALRLAESLAAGAGPYQHEARLEAALAYLRLGRPAEAVAGLQAVFHGPPGPRSAEAGYHLGCLLERTGEPGAARATWRAVITRHPETAAAVRARACLTWPGLRGRGEC